MSSQMHLVEQQQLQQLHGKGHGKAAKVLRQLAHGFVASPRNSANLIEIVKHLASGADTHAALLAVEMVFTSALRAGSMCVEVVPLKPRAATDANAADADYREWLLATYNDCWSRMLECFDHPDHKVQAQALSTAMKLLTVESKHPLERSSSSSGALAKHPLEQQQQQHLPLGRLKAILMRMILKQEAITHLVSKYQVYVAYDDVLFHTWRVLPTITAKNNPSELYITNYLLLLEKLPVTAAVGRDDDAQHQQQQLLLCFDTFVYDTDAVRRCLNKTWNCVMQWEQHTPATHKQLLLVLLERVLPHLERPLLMTDFLMDSLDAGGAVGLLALQGIFTMMQAHNLEYPNLFAKLYSMFEPEIFHTKCKARLFYLADMFLGSSHLPENLVAAFVKRLARLALVVPSEDVIIICYFIGNLILRHPGLKSMLNGGGGGLQEAASVDPFIMEERDPVRSGAIASSLWELRSLQAHALPHVAHAARIINTPLPASEWDITKYLAADSDDLFDREMRKNHKLLAIAFHRPNGYELSGGDIIAQYWNA